MRSYVAGITVALLAASPALIGCGSDDAERATALDEETIVKADFIQAANASCETRTAQVKDESRRLFARASREPREAGAKLLIERVVIPVFEGEIQDLRALEPPPGDEEQVEGIVVAFEEMVARTRRDLARGREYPFRKTEKLAAAYGLPACGHP